ncbi:ATP-binding protein [Pseudoalteromonas sp. MM17-2]|uniref:AAA family ATPase n=1 Tax=Pseudoalteromonas sp. MM17-2 TaxID=2917753 RepID=UPI001EF5E790|nr:AAA family ATPase [Pseudoalteromonas sp. MM17-2]MCG7545938.1 ATP-binding protein [Pseudoalteromonas sp. MM17-2]
MTENLSNERIQRVSKYLKNLFLDPNNYRFIDHEKHEQVSEEKVTDTRVQKAARLFIEGKNRENIRDLIASLKANGFLEVDVIQVQDLGDNRFKVLEGNRRVAALKCLQEDYDSGLPIGNLDPAIFKKVPFEIHEFDDRDKHLILMGLKHISGNKKWATFNQATLIYDYLKPYQPQSSESYVQKEEQLVGSLGITKHKLRAMQRVYNLILEYQKSDYSDQFESTMYGLFEEIIKKPTIRAWLDWDDDNYYPRNRANLDRIFSWISKTEERIHDDDELDDFDDPYEEFEPIITKSLEIRDLSLFINNEQALSVMEEERSLAQGLMASGTKDKQNYSQALSKLKDNITSLKSYQNLISSEDFDQLKEAKEQLYQLLPKQQLVDIEEGNFSVAFEYSISQHFSEISVESYKGISGLKLDSLNRINIFAGMNNSGKTSLLEAIYLLSIQNDISSFFKLAALKNKVLKLSTSWLNQELNSSIKVSGKFNNCKTQVEFSKFEAGNIDKREDYIASYSLISTIDQSSLPNTVHTYAHSPLIRENERVVKLCNSVFKSPYFYDPEDVMKEHTRAVEVKVKGRSLINIIVNFLKEIDSNIQNIRLVEHDEIRRFIVESSELSDKDLDITNYGEGLQRIWYIALSFAACSNGIICIDEFETAIHYSLLIKFTKFTQELAEEFNVQVFLTSHSKECIDAFLLNEYCNESISGFLLEKNGKEMSKKQVDGIRLLQLIESIDLDIRGATHG